MTKDKITYLLKRIVYINNMIKDGVNEKSFKISNKKEVITIDDEVRTFIAIIDEIITNEKTAWLKKIFIGIKKGHEDLYIISNSPTERTKFYDIKRAFAEKIYQCFIYKGLVSYEDVLTAKID